MTQKSNIRLSGRNKFMSYGARLVVIAFALLLILISSLPVSAQQTREEVIVQLQAKKAQELHPYVPTKGERIFERLQARGLLGQPEGFFPAFGSVYRTGSFAAGARYFNLFGEGGQFGIVGLWSVKNYKLAQMGLTLPSFGNRHVKIDMLAQYIDAPSLPFYGIGQNSDVDNKREYVWAPTTLGAKATITTVPWLYFGGGVDYLDVTTKPGDIPNIFPPATIPGIGEDPTYVRSHIFAGIDWRQSPGYSTSGGWYHADWWQYDQQNTGNFSFQEFDAEAIQLIPILRANWVIGLRGLVSLTNTDKGNVVPFFYLPNLGGGRDLRGYPDFRFMDKNRILWTIEYRWLPSKFLDMVLFYEAGKVTPNQSDLDFNNLVNTWGIGARLHGPAATPIRLEWAHSEEGSRIIFAFSPAW